MNPQFSPDEVVTAAKMNQLPKGILGYAQATATQASIGTSDTDLTGLSVAVTLVAGRRLKVTAYVKVTAGAIGRTFARVAESTTELQMSTVSHHASGASGQQQHTVTAIITPSAGAHTYKATLRGESATCSAVGAATAPIFILVEDLGAST
jgi:hypothetical protein